MNQILLLLRNPEIQAINTYMRNQTEANLDNVSRIIRENNEDPRRFLSYAVSVGNANLVEINRVGENQERKELRLLIIFGMIGEKLH